MRTLTSSSNVARSADSVGRIPAPCDLGFLRDDEDSHLRLWNRLGQVRSQSGRRSVDANLGNWIRAVGDGHEELAGFGREEAGAGAFGGPDSRPF